STAIVRFLPFTTSGTVSSRTPVGALARKACACLARAAPAPARPTPARKRRRLGFFGRSDLWSLRPAHVARRRIAKRRARDRRALLRGGTALPLFHQAAQPLAVVAARLQPGAVAQHHHVLPMKPRQQPRDRIEIDDRRSVDPQKALGIEPLLEAL